MNAASIPLDSQELNRTDTFGNLLGNAITYDVKSNASQQTQQLQ